MNSLNELLNKLDIRPYRLADLAGVTRNTVYRLARGNEIPDTNLATLRKLARAVGYRVEVKFSPKKGEK